MIDWATIGSSAAGMVAGGVVLLLAYRKAVAQLGTATRKVEIAAKSAAINGSLHALLRRMPYPAWIKVVDRDDAGAIQFRMQFINAAYTKTFGVSWEDYVGRTDFEVWPHQVAAEYYANDTTVLASHRAHRMVEPLADGLLSSNPAAGSHVEFEKVYIEREGVEAIVGFVRPLVFVPPAPGGDSVPPSPSSDREERENG